MNSNEINLQIQHLKVEGFTYILWNKSWIGITSVFSPNFQAAPMVLLAAKSAWQHFQSSIAALIFTRETYTTNNFDCGKSLIFCAKIIKFFSWDFLISKATSIPFKRGYIHIMKVLSKYKSNLFNLKTFPRRRTSTIISFQSSNMIFDRRFSSVRSVSWRNTNKLTMIYLLLARKVNTSSKLMNEQSRRYYMLKMPFDSKEGEKLSGAIWIDEMQSSRKSSLVLLIKLAIHHEDTKNIR